jgi:glycosyltransferase involved in cell wall biosynthesis
VKIAITVERDDPVSRVLDGVFVRLKDAGHDVIRSPSSYADVDAAIFLAYEDVWHRIRETQPNLRIVLADPKQSSPEWIAAARDADVLIVSSVEQRDVFLRHNRSCVIVPMCPPLPFQPREHEDREPLVVAYHGNRVHLECMVRGPKQAIEALGRDRPVEFVAVYNIEANGRAELGMPNGPGVTVRHVQWSADVAPETGVSATVIDELRRADIGIVPSEQPIRDPLNALEAVAFSEPAFVHEPFDHLVRFKASTNAGRAWPFARLGVPVVADFAPSLAQLIEDGVSGMLASSPEAWHHALTSLAESAERRTAYACELNRRFEAALARSTDDLVAALTANTSPPEPVRIDGFPTASEQLARLGRYRGTTPLPARTRVLSRIRRMLRS